MTKILILISAFALSACSDPAYVANDLGKAISAELRENNYSFIDLSLVAGGAWSRVCFFGPYNERSSEALGFEWNVGEHTNVLRSDGHDVIVFATESKVVEYVVHSRSNGDFAELSGECFPRKAARLERDSENGEWRAPLPSKA